MATEAGKGLILGTVTAFSGESRKVWVKVSGRRQLGSRLEEGQVGAHMLDTSAETPLLHPGWS